MFAKKNTEIEEQAFEEITDEQLSQVTGGAGLVTGLLNNLTSNTSVQFGIGIALGVSNSTSTGSSSSTSAGLLGL